MLYKRRKIPERHPHSWFENKMPTPWLIKKRPTIEHKKLDTTNNEPQQKLVIFGAPEV